MPFGFPSAPGIFQRSTIGVIVLLSVEPDHILMFGKARRDRRELEVDSKQCPSLLNKCWSREIHTPGAKHSLYWPLLNTRSQVWFKEDTHHSRDTIIYHRSESIPVICVWWVPGTFWSSRIRNWWPTISRWHCSVRSPLNSSSWVELVMWSAQTTLQTWVCHH